MTDESYGCDTTLIERSSPKMQALVEALSNKEAQVHFTGAVARTLTATLFDVRLDIEGREELPKEVYAETRTNINNTDGEQGWTEEITLTKEIAVSRSVTFTKKLTNTTKVTAHGGMKFPSGADVGVSSEMVKSIEITDGKTYSETEKVTEGNKRTISIKTPPHSILEVKIERVVGKLRVPFKATAVFDGVVRAKGRLYLKTAFGPVQKPFKKDYVLSDILSVEERTFEIDGEVVSGTASGITVEYRELPLKQDGAPILNSLFAHHVTNLEWQVLTMPCESCEEMFDACMSEADPEYPMSYAVCQLLWDQCKADCEPKKT